MEPSLAPCSECRRHVRASEPRCPFCGHQRLCDAPPGGVGLGATLALSAALLVLGCKNGNVEPDPTTTSGQPTATSAAGAGGASGATSANGGGSSGAAQGSVGGAAQGSAGGAGSGGAAGEGGAAGGVVAPSTATASAGARPTSTGTSPPAPATATTGHGGIHRPAPKYGMPPHLRQGAPKYGMPPVDF
jgi:hypothetical protein